MSTTLIPQRNKKDVVWRKKIPSSVLLHNLEPNTAGPPRRAVDHVQPFVAELQPVR